MHRYGLQLAWGGPAHVAPNVRTNRLAGLAAWTSACPSLSAGRVLPSTNRSTDHATFPGCSMLVLAQLIGYAPSKKKVAWVCSSVQYTPFPCSTATLSEVQFSTQSPRTASHRIWRRPECILPITRLPNSHIPSSILHLQSMQCGVSFPIASSLRAYFGIGT